MPRIQTELEAEQGSVLVILGAVTLALVSLLALAIDGAVIATSEARYNHVADFAVLAALRGYSTTSGDNATRLAAAAARASEVTGINVQSFIDSGLVAGGQDQDDIQVAGSADAGGANGKLIPGQWHFVETPSAPPECFDGATFRPCFEEITSAETANAFRLELKLHEDASLRTFFAKVFSFDTVQLRAVATAALVPRRGVFLMDLNRSITRGRHADWDSKAEYAFHSTSTDCSTLEAGDQTIYDALPSIRPIGQTSVFRHFQDDYACIRVGDYLSPNEPTVEDDYYNIDTFADPEPLTSVLDGANILLQAFVDRAVTGDEVGIIGFDSEILPVRQMNLTTPNALTGPYSEFLSATDTSSQSNKYVKYLFPRKLTPSGDTVFSDMRTALETAYDMLVPSPPPADPSAASLLTLSENYIILVTDGMSTCPQSPPTPGTPCEESETYIRQAVNEIQSYLASDFDSERIALHVIIANPKVGPHTLVRAAGGGSGGCLSDGNTRDEGYSFTDPDDLNSWPVTPASWSDPSAPILFPNTLHGDASGLSGLWGPVRPCCRPSAGGGALSSCDDFVDELNDACNLASDRGDIVADVTSFGAYVGGDTGDTNYAELPGVDSNGRLFCEPENKTERDQILDYIQRVLSNPPMMIVE